MRFAKILFLLLGVGLLAYVLSEADLGLIWAQISGFSGWGLVVVFCVYCLYFGADVISWRYTFETVPMSAQWLARLYLVRMIGEAYNNITPMASVGGEPIKAWVLKTRYGVPLRDTGASLVLAKTASMFSLVVFIFFAVVFALEHERLLVEHKQFVVAAFLWFVFNIIVLFLMQHLRLSSIAATRLGKTRFGEKLMTVISGLHEMDDQFARFYQKPRARLWTAMAWAMMNWMFGAAELYAILYFLGYPISWTEAWLIEAMLQLIRAVAFFIPAGLGVQEGTLMFAYAAISGSPTPGIAAALIRRFRELVWISLSLLLGFIFHLNDGDPALCDQRR